MQFQSSDFELFYLVVGLIGLVITITWIVFPFLVLSRQSRQIEVLDAIHRELVDIQRKRIDLPPDYPT